MGRLSGIFEGTGRFRLAGRIFLFCTCDQLLAPWCVPAGLVYDLLYARREADLCCDVATAFQKKGTKKTASGNGCSACGGCPEMIHYELVEVVCLRRYRPVRCWRIGPVILFKASFTRNKSFLLSLF